MKKRVKRLKDNFYEEVDDNDWSFLPDIPIYKVGVVEFLGLTPQTQLSIQWTIRNSA